MIIDSPIISGSLILTGSAAFTGSLTLSGSMNTVGTITATTLVVQTITSSISSITGSTSFGSSSISNHNFTGSLIVSGAMFVSSSGNVGIGTLVPTNKLDVVNAGVNAIRVQNTLNTSDAYLIAQNTLGSTFFGINATGGYIYNLATLPILFYTSGSERMRITATGSVGIGTTSPSYTLSFGGDAATTIGMNQSILGTSPALTLRGADSTTGTNNEGGPIFISSGLGTGNGATSNIIFSTGAPGGSGATRQTLTERMRITAAGNVGIGTSSPNAAAYAGRVLTIGSGTTYENALELNAYNITDDTLSDVAFLNGASSDVDKRVCLVRANRSGANNSGALLFYTKNSGTFGERMRIGADGRVFIGIAGSSNGHKLEINAGTTSAIRVDVTSGTSGLSMSPGATLGIDKPGVGGGTLFINSTGQILVNTNATVLTSGWLCIAVESSNYNAVVLKDTGTTYSSGNYYQLFTNSNNGIAGGIVHNSASTVSYYTGPSDARLKSNIQDWTQEVLPLFADIKPKTYNHIEDNDESVVYKGYLAQDMIDKFPEAYGQNKDGYYTFNPNGYIPYLVKAMQELNTKLDAANAEIEALKAK